MPALPTGIITQLTGSTHHPKLAQAHLRAVDMAEGEVPPWVEQAGGSDQIAFQYWPESLSDTRPSEWNPRSIPGGSHPIYQWTHGGERQISFTTVFTRDHEPPEVEQEHVGGIGAAIGTAVDAVNSAASAIGLGGPEVDKMRNIPIESAINWLRYFTYPYYVEGDLRVFEPPKCILVLPGTNLGHRIGEDDITCVMTTCDVTYEAFFPNGRPRIVEVSLAFSETVQKGGRVTFHNRADMKLAGDVVKALAVKGDSESGDIFEDISGAISGAVGL